VRMLHQLHAHFTPEEFIRVECVPQNRESADRYRKANAGRARLHASRRGKELMPDEASSTIACVSGFLFNMVDRTVRLVTPCHGSARWPLGYWTYEQGEFDSPDSLRALLEGMVERHMPMFLGCDDVVRLRADLRLETGEDSELIFRSNAVRTTFRGVCGAEPLAALLREGTRTAGEIALTRENDSDVPMTETFVLLGDVFARGLLDEEPRGSGVARPDAAAV
jgi:hypothetical protein